MRFVQIPRVPGDPLEVVGEFEPRGNLCPTDSCDFLNEFGRFVAVPKDVLSQRRLWVFSENCNSIDLSKTFWWEPHELEEEFVEKVTEKYAFIGLRGAYSRRDALFVFWIEDCERPLNLCSAQCVQINDIIPAFMQRVPVVSKKCWRCNYRDFEILAFVSHTASGDFSQICPECPDYSSLLLVYDARVKDSVIVSFGKIVLTGKAATEPQNWRFWYNFHGEQIHLQRSVGPNGENANVFWFSNTTPGAYTVHYSNINYPYCIYELEINVIGVGCADSDILISRFIAPNSFIIEDASGCDVEIFTVNGEDLTTSIQRNGNRWTIPGRNWTGLDVTVSYSNDCGCSKTRVFYSAVSLSEDCFTETLNEKMKSFFSAFGKALESNFASTGSISLSPFHQNYHESLLNFFVENCNEACKSFVEYPSQVPPNINFSEFFGWVFDCGYEISYTKHIENHPAPANLNFQSYWDLITLHSLTVVVSSPLSPQNKYFYGFVASRLRRRADGAIFVAYDHRLHRVQGNHLYYSPTLDFFTTNPEDAYRQSNFSSLHSIEPLELFV